MSQNTESRSKILAQYREALSWNLSFIDIIFSVIPYQLLIGKLMMRDCQIPFPSNRWIRDVSQRS